MDANDFLRIFEELEPVIAGAVSLYPPAAPIVAMVQPFVPKTEKLVEMALAAITSKNGGDPKAAFLEFLNHITMGAPNSPILSGPAPQTF
jgi:hypothetical protein